MLDPLVLDADAVTVFVGPNNSGKSLILREIHGYLDKGPHLPRVIVERALLDWPTPEEAVARFQSRKVEPMQGQNPVPAGSFRVQKTSPATGGVEFLDVHETVMVQSLQQEWEAQQRGELREPNAVWSGVYSHFLALFTIALDGRTRFALTDARSAGDLLRAPQNHLAALFIDEAARATVREITRDALGLHFVIDPTNVGQLRIRMSQRAPADTAEEPSLDIRARKFHAEAADIALLSDGVKAFTGLVSSLMSSDYSVMLVDEPEAFLHPPLARKLGAVIASIGMRKQARVIAATHSPHFLMGCMDAGTRLNIVRLTYSGGQGQARTLSGARITALMRDPLLRSTGVLNALFHTCAVVCEADRDRAFYEEVNSRMLADGRPAVADGIFLNAQNWQTVRRIVAPLRAMGIPAAAILDLDVIGRGPEFKDLLNACAVPAALVNSLTTLRGQVDASFREPGADVKRGGISSLAGDAAIACQSLVEQLATFGVFLLPVGEIEAWLGYLEVVASKENWLAAVFERMGADPDQASYVRPQNADVWDFVLRVARWIRDPMRLGMPAAE